MGGAQSLPCFCLFVKQAFEYRVAQKQIPRWGFGAKLLWKYLKTLKHERGKKVNKERRAKGPGENSGMAWEAWILH